ncbi:TerB family tellurite resistance protein [Dongia deserti]|uniref:TerB family tellurite resistance protein n=1 Tax=Dongia deserti TaxID=2268030 RepID=UPI000E648FE8|nr:TerB family tellurite resistance protein [Dongia deserti]
MSIWGKIIGGVAGFALGGPLGALLGAIAGHAADMRIDQAEPAAPDDHQLDDRSATRQIAFTIAVIVLGAKMAKADGVVSRAEVAAFKEVFQVPSHEMKNVARLFDRAKQDPAGFEPYAKQVARMFRKDHPVLEELLDGLFHIAKADGGVHEAEVAYLKSVANIFGLDENDFARIREGHLGADKADPYTILGIRRTASNEEIKAAWRKLVRDTHPDTLMAQGLPREFIDMANEKLATINAAYDKVAKERGIN